MIPDHYYSLHRADFPVNERYWKLMKSLFKFFLFVVVATLVATIFGAASLSQTTSENLSFTLGALFLLLFAFVAFAFFMVWAMGFIPALFVWIGLIFRQKWLMALGQVFAAIASLTAAIALFCTGVVAIMGVFVSTKAESFVASNLTPGSAAADFILNILRLGVVAISIAAILNILAFIFAVDLFRLSLRSLVELSDVNAGSIYNDSFLTIRNGGAQDLKGLVSIVNEWGQWEPSETKRFEENSKALLATGEWRVACRGGTMVGFSVTVRSTCMFIFVDAALRKQGIYSRLLKDCITMASRQGYGTLGIQRSSSNSRGLSLQKSLGYALEENQGGVAFYTPNLKPQLST